MGLNTYPSNPFPPSTDRMDVDALETEVSKLNNDVSELKSGLTNVQDDVKLNTQDLTTPSRTKNLVVSIPTASVNGIDFTAQNDGGLKVEGASTAYAYTESIFALNKGSYKITKGNNNDGGRIYVQVRNNNDDALIIEKLDASEGQFTLNEATVIKFRVAVYSGETVNSTIYPMIRLATITDPTFAPYIPSVESRIEAVESGLTSIFLPTSRLTTVNDLDDVIKPGAYYFRDADNPANAPTSNCYIAVIRQYDNSPRIAQIAYSFSVNTIYVRKTLDWGSTWGDWYSLDNTQVTQ